MAWSSTSGALSENLLLSANNSGGAITDGGVAVDGTYEVEAGHPIPVNLAIFGPNFAPLIGDETFDVGSLTIEFDGTELASTSDATQVTSTSLNLEPSGTFTSSGGDVITAEVLGSGNIQNSHEGEPFDVRSGEARVYLSSTGPDTAVAMGGGNQLFTGTPTSGPGVNVGSFDNGYPDYTGWEIVVDWVVAGGDSATEYSYEVNGDGTSPTSIFSGAGPASGTTTVSGLVPGDFVHFTFNATTAAVSDPATADSYMDLTGDTTPANRGPENIVIDPPEVDGASVRYFVKPV